MVFVISKVNHNKEFTLEITVTAQCMYSRISRRFVHLFVTSSKFHLDMFNMFNNPLYFVFMFDNNSYFLSVFSNHTDCKLFLICILKNPFEVLHIIHLHFL